MRLARIRYCPFSSLSKCVFLSRGSLPPSGRSRELAAGSDSLRWIRAGRFLNTEAARTPRRCRFAIAALLDPNALMFEFEKGESKMTRKFWFWFSAITVLSLLVGACGAATSTPTAEPTRMMEPTQVMAPIDCMGASPGEVVSVLYQWSGAEEEKFSQAVQPVVEACGLVLAPESSRDQALLDTRVQAGNPWDIVIWPSTGPLSTYTDQLVPLADAGATAANYEDFWLQLGAAGGAWFAVPVKADIKSIIWYNPLAFEAAGYRVPTTFDQLEALVEQMVADGRVPWSMGMESGDATGWTGSDFIQDLLLTFEGPDYVLGLIDGSIPYNDPGVAAVYEQYRKWAADERYTVGGANGTLSTGFLAAIHKPFADPPEAMMVKQSGFAGGAIVEQFPELLYGEDFDFFAFPGAQGMQGGADWLMVFENKPAVQAVVAYLTSRAGAQRWASVGFDLSPNNHATRAYADAQLQKKALALATSSGFTPDLGDTIPGWASAEWTAIVDVLSGAAQISEALNTAAAAQAEALAP